MYTNKNIETLINISEDFIIFLDGLYTEGIITYEQFENMTTIKKQFLNKQNYIIRNK